MTVLTNPESIPLVIELVMAYQDPFSRHEDSFWLLNDSEYTVSDINHVFKRMAERGDCLAPMYGLPQLAPVDHPEEAGGTKHPYSSLVKLTPYEKAPKGMRLDDSSELLMISSFYESMMTGKPTKQYLEARHEFLTTRCLTFIDEAGAHFNELGLDAKELLSAKAKLVTE